MSEEIYTAFDELQKSYNKYDPFPALTLKEPYASFVAANIKPVETRKWKTDYRGKLLLCAGASLDKQAAATNPNMMRLYNTIGPDGKPFRLQYGKALCVATLVDCVPMQPEHEQEACIQVYKDAWAWLLVDIVPIEPFFIKGSLKLFDPKLSEKGIEIKYL